MTATAVGGTYPTGMHSCLMLIMVSSKQRKILH